VFETITVKFDWKTIGLLGLGWAAEYAMLSLIEDSPEILKAATLICALAGIAILTSHDVLRHKRIKVFWLLAVLIGVIYLSFVGLALTGIANKWNVERGLKRIYGESTPLTLMSVGSDNEQKDFKLSFKEWERRSADWIAINVGLVAYGHFLSRHDHWGDCNDFSCFRERLEIDRANLLEIIGNEKYAD